MAKLKLPGTISIYLRFFEILLGAAIVGVAGYATWYVTHDLTKESPTQKASNGVLYLTYVLNTQTWGAICVAIAAGSVAILGGITGAILMKGVMAWTKAFTVLLVVDTFTALICIAAGGAIFGDKKFYTDRGYDGDSRMNSVTNATGALCFVAAGLALVLLGLVAYLLHSERFRGGAVPLVIENYKNNSSMEENDRMFLQNEEPVFEQRHYPSTNTNEYSEYKPTYQGFQDVVPASTIDSSTDGLRQNSHGRTNESGYETSGYQRVDSGKDSNP